LTDAGDGLRNHWMERAKEYCGRKPNHRGDHRRRSSLTDSRPRKTARRIGVRVPDKRLRAKAYRLSRYGITQKQFDRLLEVQDYACGMCFEPFPEDSVICVDHDHAHCPDEKRSCGKCIRGLLCLDCNTTLGKIERKLKMAQAYMAAPPGKMLPAA